MNGRTQLTALDVRIMNFNGCSAFFFRGRLDFFRMAKGLSEMAGEIPGISGRIIKEGSTHYILNNNAGFKFLVDHDDRSIDSVGRFCLYKYEEPLAGKIVNENESVFNVKISRFRDGDLLCVNYSHAICDGVGLCGLLVRWARLCRGGSPLPAMNLDRKPLLDLEEAGFDSRPSEGALRKGGGKSYEYVHKKFRLAFSEFERLKVDILSDAENSGPWISTRDVVIAKLLKEISFVKDAEGDICVISVINFRANRELNLGDHYFGNAISSAEAIYQISNLRRDDLVSVARQYRASADSARSLAAIKEAVNYKGVGRLADTILFVNDVSRFPLHEMDFGSGLPHLYEVALPRGGQIDTAEWFGSSIVNSIFLLPENPGDESYLPVWIGLLEHEMELFLKRNSSEALFIF